MDKAGKLNSGHVSTINHQDNFLGTTKTLPVSPKWEFGGLLKTLKCKTRKLNWCKHTVYK